MKQPTILKILICLLLPMMMFASLTIVDTKNEIEGITSLTAGDTVMVKAGTYTDIIISFAGNGTMADSVVFMAEEPGQVLFNGLSKLYFSGQYVKISGLFFVNGYSTSGKSVIETRRNGIRANNSRITECAIVNYNPANKDTDYKWLSMYGKNNRVDHCHFEGKKHSGTTFVIWLVTTLDRPNYHRVDHNYFGPRPELGYNGGETIRIGTSDYSLTDSRSVLEYNVFDRCNGETEIISNKSCENIYRHNTFFECQGTLTLRHGRRCLVDGNYFFGNNQSNTGGIRIIGEDHVVINNYLQDLAGSGYKSGICIVRGVEDSPLYRYYPVERAFVANNTLINVRYPLVFNYAASDDQTVAPDSCVIVNNAINAGSTNDVLYFYGPLERFIWAGNIFFGDKLGESDPGGILWTDPKFGMVSGGIYRPASDSPLIDAGVPGYIALGEDIDGHARGASFDVGADEVSTEPIKYRPLAKEDVGPGWDVEIKTLIEVPAGENTLAEALDRIVPGDTLKLITPAGNYSLSEDMVIDKELTILSDFEEDQRPVIYCHTSDPIFTLNNKAKLYLNNLRIDGYNSVGSKDNLIRSGNYASGLQVVKLVAKHCLFAVSGVTLEGVTCLEINSNVRADSLHFDHCEFKGFSDVIFDLDEVIPGSADFRAENVVLENSTFWNNAGGVLTINAGDAIPFTAGPRIIIDHCTMDDCAGADKVTLNLVDVDASEIHNTIITNSSMDTAAVTLYGWGYINYSNVYSSGSISLYRDAHINAGMTYVDPNYADAVNGDFTLPRSNPLLTSSEDGGGIGDPRWLLDYTAVDDQAVGIPASMTLNAYPNPANANVHIDYELFNSDRGILKIYDINGSLQKTILVNEKKSNIRLDLDDLGSGIWLLRLSDGTEYLTKKIMVLK